MSGALIVPVGVAVGGWLVWKLGYYGTFSEHLLCEGRMELVKGMEWGPLPGAISPLVPPVALPWCLFLHAVKVRGAGERGGRAYWPPE